MNSILCEKFRLSRSQLAVVATVKLLESAFPQCLMRSSPAIQKKLFPHSKANLSSHIKRSFLLAGPGISECLWSAKDVL